MGMRSSQHANILTKEAMAIRVSDSIVARVESNGHKCFKSAEAIASHMADVCPMWFMIHLAAALDMEIEQ